MSIPHNSDFHHGLLGEVLRADAERIAGAKGKRRRKRTATTGAP